MFLSASSRRELETSKVSDVFGVLWASALVINYSLNENYFSLIAGPLLQFEVTVSYSSAVHLSKEPGSSSLVPESGYQVPSKQVQFPRLPPLISLPYHLSSNGLAPIHQHLPDTPFIQTWMRCYRKLRRVQGCTEARRNATNPNFKYHILQLLKPASFHQYIPQPECLQLV